MPRKPLSSLDSDSIEEPEVNLTPLIDVVFVVLITFILVAPILEIDSVKLASSNGKEALSEKILQITVKNDNTIWYRSKKISLKELKKELKTTPKKTIPQLFFDQRAEFGTYQSLKNMFESIGFEQLDIVLAPR